MLIFKLKPRPFKFFLLNRCKAYYIGPTIMSSSPLSDMQKKNEEDFYVLLKCITNKGTRNIKIKKINGLITEVRSDFNIYGTRYF